jgi:hypothetical protein
MRELIQGFKISPGSGVLDKYSLRYSTRNMGGSSVNNKPPEGILVIINKVEGSWVIFAKIGGSSVNCRIF